MSDTLLVILITEYVALAVCTLVEGKYIMSLYWFGATLLNIAVFFLSKRS